MPGTKAITSSIQDEVSNLIMEWKANSNLSRETNSCCVWLCGLSYQSRLFCRVLVGFGDLFVYDVSSFLVELAQGLYIVLFPRLFSCSLKALQMPQVLNSPPPNSPAEFVSDKKLEKYRWPNYIFCSWLITTKH